MAFTKVGPKYQVTIPKEARKAIGFNVGDVVETTVSKNQIVIRPKVVVDRHFEIMAQLQEALADVKAGRVSKIFHSVDELMADLNGKRPKNKSKKRR